MFKTPSFGRNTAPASGYPHGGQLKLLWRVLCLFLWLSAALGGALSAAPTYTVKESPGASNRVGLDDAGNLTVTGAIVTGLGTISRPTDGRQTVFYKLNSGKILMREDCVSTTSTGMVGNLYLSGNLISSASLVKQSDDGWCAYGPSGLVAKLDDAGNFYLKGQLTAPACTLSAIARTSQRVDLDWRGGMTNLSGYHVYRSDNGGSLALLTTVGAAQTRYVDKSTVAGHTYQYRVTPYFTGGEATASNLVSVTTPSAAYYYETWDAVSAPHWPEGNYLAGMSGTVAGSDNVWNWDTLTTSVTKCSFRNSWNGWEAGRFLEGTDSGDFSLKGATTWFSFNTTNSLRTGFEAKLDAVDDQADRAISFEIRNETSYLGGGSVRICLDGQSSHKALTIQAMDRGTRSNELKTTLSLSTANEYWITAQFQPDSNGLRAAYAVYSKDALNTPLASGEGLLDQIPLVVLDQTSMSFPRRAVGSVDDIELAGIMNPLGTQSWVYAFPQNDGSESGGGDTTPPPEEDESGTPVNPTQPTNFPIGDTETQVNSGGGTTVLPSHILNGLSAHGMAGWSVSSLGDVNGDGYDDVIIGSPWAKFDPDHPSKWDLFSGEIYLIYGPLSANSSGMRLRPAQSELPELRATSAVGMAVSGAGDVNGDGINDVLIGAPWAMCPASLGVPARNAGQVYLLYGASQITATLGQADVTKEIIFEGEAKGDNAGMALSSVGDFNGDGVNDFAIAAPYAACGTKQGAGKVYLVSGAYLPRAANGVIQLASLASSGGGWEFQGAATGDHLGWSVAGAQDVNGDGFMDLLIGAPDAKIDTMTHAGKVYLVSGREITTTTQTVFPLEQTQTGIKVWNGLSNNRTGFSVAGVGDVNGDALGDVLIGAPYDSPTAQTKDSGMAMLLLNAATAVDLNGATTLLGAKAGSLTGASVSGAGDLNGDGQADLIIGAPGYDVSTALTHAGAFYLWPGPCNTDAWTTSGGTVAHAALGRSVSTAGDILSPSGVAQIDGLPDLLLGAPGDFPWGSVEKTTGSLLTLAGLNIQPPNCLSYQMNYKSGVTAPFGPGEVRNVTPPSRCWIEYSGGTGPEESNASLTSVTLFRMQPSVDNFGANATVAALYWHVTSSRTASANTKIRLRYFPAEVTGQNESELCVYQAESLNGPWQELKNQHHSMNSHTISATAGNAGNMYFIIAQRQFLLKGSVAANGNRLTWDDLSAESGFQEYAIYRRLSNDPSAAIQIAATTPNSFLDAEVDTEQYSYYIEAVFENGTRASNIITLDPATACEQAHPLEW